MNRAHPSGLGKIPSVDRVVRALGECDLPRPIVVATVRRVLADVREQTRANDDAAGSAGDGASGAEIDRDVISRIGAALDDLRRARIQPVINATGILIHTNFGRSPLGPAVVHTLETIASQYSNLEYDLTGGNRGGRAAYLEQCLAVLCVAEAATVVNNCAAALVLILRHFADGRFGTAPPRTHVVISRGELVQIGGGFRIPEILEASGATLREIGTTNKTTLDDYRRAIDPQTAMVLKVHRSNFFMGGFVDSPPTHEIAAVARQAGVPFVEDLGSGATFDTSRIAGQIARGDGGADHDVAANRSAGIAATEHEPTPAEVLSEGADLVCFSGDKLLGGPQAGIIAGRADHIAALKREPFFRALRCDKLILGALQTTVELLLSERFNDIPIRAMMQIPIDQLRRRARNIIAQLQDLPVAASLGACESQVGGGALPRTSIPSIGIDVVAPAGQSLEQFAARLRAGSPPLIGYIASDRFKLDLRTVFESQDDALVAQLRKCAARS